MMENDPYYEICGHISIDPAQPIPRPSPTGIQYHRNIFSFASLNTGGDPSDQ